MKRGAHGAVGHDLRHQELRHDEEGAGLARGAGRRLDRARLEAWAGEVGWESLLNRAGTTFKKLPDGAKAGLDQGKAIALMLDQPSMIKRPVLDTGKGLIVGFKPEIYEKALA
jgi:arsenate reductase-like glutaredoxin family protein